MAIPKITIHEKPIEWYVDRLKTKNYFSFAGFSDAEWFSILGMRLGTYTGFGQLISDPHGKLLADVIRRRQHDPRFLFAIPKVLWTLPGLERGLIDKWLGQNGVSIEGYERDMVLDDLAKDGGLFPLIQQLKKMPITFIGNKVFFKSELKHILEWKKFIPITSPNHHVWTYPIGKSYIQRTVEDILFKPIPGVYLVSAGVSAAVIIDQICDKIPDSFFIDTGSIWDVFAGIGGQRQWRADLYTNPEELTKWKKKTLTGVG